MTPRHGRWPDQGAHGQGSHHQGDDLLFFALVVGVVLGGLLWAAWALSALVSGHAVPDGKPLAGVVALARPTVDPAVAWGAPVGPPVLYWTCTVVVLGVAGLLVVVGWSASDGALTARHRRLHFNLGEPRVTFHCQCRRLVTHCRSAAKEWAHPPLN